MFNLKKLSNHKIIILILFLFALFKLITLFKFHHPIWDEAIYLASGKYIYSLGQAGFYEIIRPLFLSAIIGIFWKIGWNYIFWSEVIEILFGLGTVLMTYLIGLKLFNKKVAIFSAFILAITPLFFLQSSYILTEIPSTFFALLSFYLILKNNFYWAGLFAGFSFLMKFPQAIFTLAVGAYFIHKLIVDKKYKQTIFNVLKFVLVFSLLLSCFLVFNYHFYDLAEEDPASSTGASGVWDLSMRPIIFGAKNIYSDNFFNQKQPSWFYITEICLHNPLYILSFIGFWFYFKKYFKNNSLLFYSFIFFFIYYSITGHKELRYAFSFMPFLAIFAGIGFENISLKFKKTIPKLIFVVIFLLVVCALLSNISTTFSYRSNVEPSIVTDYYAFFRDTPVSGSIITSDPVVGAYVDNRVYPAYYSMPFLKQRLATVDYSAVFFNPEVFPCLPGDSHCNEELIIIMDNLLNNNLVYKGEYYGQTKYIFTTKNYFTNLPKEDVYTEYNLSEKVVLSKFPDDKFIVSVILEDFPSLNDEKTDIWERENYEFMLNYFEKKNLSISAAIIPTHLNDLSRADVFKLKNSGFSFIQNGYSHSDELMQPLVEQRADILKGRKIISNILNKNVSAFIAPYYSTNKNSILALEDLGYEIYVSTPGDSSKTNMHRYDHKMTLITNWKNKELMSEEELINSIEYSSSYEPYLLISLYYYMFDNSSFKILDSFVNHSSKFEWFDIYQLNEWQSLIEEVVFSIDDNNLIVSGPKSVLSENITLKIRASGNFSLNTNYKSIKIKNIAKNNIIICFEQCVTLEPGELQIIYS
jgi:hypothetical protein